VAAPFGFTVPLRVAFVLVSEVADPVIAVGAVPEAITVTVTGEDAMQM
jgi:hypothetical protein